MSETKRPSATSPWKKASGFLLLMTGAGVCGYFVAKFFKNAPMVRAAMDALTGWDLLALPLLWLLAVGLHEAGHLAGGISRGMRFLLFIVGPFGWIRSGDDIRFRWYFNLGTLGGVAAALPAPDRPLKPQLLRLVAGGPLTSLVLGVVALLAFPQLEGRWAAYALILGALSLMIFLVTAAPMRAGGFMSDGLQFLQLHRNPSLVERRMHLTTLMGVSLSGVRPREIAPALLDQALAHTGDEAVYDMGVWFYSYLHALDGGDIETAACWLDKIEAQVDQYPDGFRQGVTLELAMFEALHRRRLPEAQAWLARSKGGIVDASRRGLAEAAVAALAGDPKAAGLALDKAERQLGRGMDASMTWLGADQIAALRQSLAAPAPTA